MLSEIGILKTKPMKDLGVRLKALRKDNRLSVPELSDLCKVSQPSIYNVESGKTKNPRRETIDSILSAYDLHYDDFVNSQKPKKEDLLSLVRQYMYTKKLSQKEFGELCDLSESTISKILRKDPSVHRTSYNKVIRCVKGKDFFANREISVSDGHSEYTMITKKTVTDKIRPREPLVVKRFSTPELVSKMSDDSKKNSLPSIEVLELKKENIELKLLINRSGNSAIELINTRIDKATESFEESTTMLDNYAKGENESLQAHFKSKQDIQSGILTELRVIKAILESYDN